MAYKYNPPPDNPVRETQKRITDEFYRWRDQANDQATVQRWDFPIPSKIGGQEAVVRFDLRGRDMEIRVDKFDKYGINLTAAFLAIQSMRLNEARGISETLQRAYALLPEPAGHRDPYEVLGVHSTMLLEDIEAVYRRRANRAGEGSPEILELNLAMERIREDKR